MFDDAGAHAVIEHHRVMFEMILKMHVGRQRGMRLHQAELAA